MFRVAALPVEALPTLAEVAKRAEVMAAVAIASPDLIDALASRPKDEGVRAAHMRYLARMATRATPYGLFAGCGVGHIGERTRVDLPSSTTWRRTTELDTAHLETLAAERAIALRDRIKYRLNDSLHRVGGRWHVIASGGSADERSYHLVGVGDSTHLRRALERARGGATFDQISERVALHGVARDRASRFTQQLVDAQVLIATLAIPVTGARPVDALIEQLEQLGDHETVAALSETRARLAAMDVSPDLPTPEQLHRLGHRVHAVMTVQPVEASLSRADTTAIAHGGELLRRLTPPQESDLERFRDAFRARYEAREVPLLEALDPDNGVGFGAESDYASRLSVATGRREQRLLELLHRAWSTSAIEIVLDAHDVDALANEDAPPLPAAAAVIATVARTENGDRIVVSAVHGPSGVGVLGRFCHASRDVDELVRAHLMAEEAHDPAAIFAEIAHAPGGRLLNVVTRPVLRDYEIEVLGRSGAAAERRIALADLSVSLQDGRFVLRSKALGRRVHPRLTNAHNYDRRSPGLYRFLAAVQADGVLDRAAWSWAPFEASPSTPRVRVGRLVLALARWRLTRTELAEPVQTWRHRRGLPQWICLVEGDNLVAFDLDDPQSIETLVRTVRGRDGAVFEELYPAPAELIATSPSGHHTLEIVLPLTRAGAAQDPPGELAEDAGAVQRVFAPGSTWTYLELHAGSAAAERVLLERVAPCIAGLRAAGAASGWFFLRYQDPSFHLRVRVHGEVALVRAALDELVAAALENGEIHDARYGTYRREVERYGGSVGIVLAEQLFEADSDAVVDLLLELAPDAGPNARWRLGVLGAEVLLADLGLDEQARAIFTRLQRDALANRVDTATRHDIDRKVRAELAGIRELLGATPPHTLVRRSQRIAPIAALLAALEAEGRLTVPIDRLAASFVHMWLNRISRWDALRSEHVAYAVLARVHEVRGHIGT